MNQMIMLPSSCPSIHSGNPFVSASIAISLLIAAIQLGYLQISNRLKSAWVRLILMSPLIAIQVLTPLLFSCEAPNHLIFRCISIFSLAWMGAMKLIGSAFNRGPLSSEWLQQHQYKRWQLVGVALLPIMPSARQSGKLRGKLMGRLTDSAGGGFGILARWTVKTLLLIGISQLLQNWPPPSRDLAPGIAFLRDLVSAGLSYTFLGFWDYPGAFAVGVLHLDITPTFDQPWLSSSLRDFWTNRWNVATSSLLRSVLFVTPMKGRQSRGPHGIAYEIKRALGILVVFFFSGLLHEFAFWMVRVDYHSTNLRWMSFCLSSGLGLIIERAVIKSTSFKLSPTFSIPLTTVILLAYGHTFSCSSEFEVLIPMFASNSTM